MNNTPQYQEARYVIPAHDAVEHHRQGTTFGCLNSSGDFYVKFGAEPRTAFRKGLTFTAPKEFQTVRIENRGDEPITVEIFVANGDLRDSRLTLPSDLMTFQGSARSLHSRRETIKSGERIKVAETNAKRLELHVSNMGGKPVFIGDQDIAWGRGTPIASGSTAILNVQCEVFAYTQAEGGQILSILETEL